MARLSTQALLALPLHKRIREARERAGLRQEDLAAKLGVSRWTVLRWERAVHAPTGDSPKLLARLFRYPAEVFEGPPQPLARADLEGRLEELGEVVVQLAQELEEIAKRVTALEGARQSGPRTGELRR